MGFFKDLADDAVEVGNDAAEKGGSVLDEIFDMSAMDKKADENEATEADTGVDSLFNDVSEPQDAVDEALIENLLDPSAADAGAEIADEPEEEIVVDDTPAVPIRSAEDLSENDSDQVTVITKGTTINGSIVSDCSLNVMGTINGDIECIGKLTISGSVVGNSVASDVYVNAKRLDGNIDSEGTVKIGLGTVVVGDIKAGSGVIAGAVKGELDIKGPVIIDSTAIIKGNVKAKSVQMNNGAVLEGFCSLAYADVDIDDIFE
ncbi:MAG: polymer-forming cytoskeletal protein [Lachnospiraceae bacterium]|nr:polymer-forming cytoskeletal protein [Lachnospiraceae bacterium]